MAGEFVRSAEAFCAARELANVWFFASVRPDVSCLVLQSMKGFLANRALVRPWQVVTLVVLYLLLLRALERGTHEADAGGGHGGCRSGGGLTRSVLRRRRRCEYFLLRVVLGR